MLGSFNCRSSVGQIQSYTGQQMEGQLFGEYLCDSVPKMFFCFKVHYHLFRRVFIVCKQARQAEGKGTWPTLWLCCMTYLPFGVLYKELYLVCRANYFSKQKRTVIMVWKHDRFQFNAQSRYCERLGYLAVVRQASCTDSSRSVAYHQWESLSRQRSSWPSEKQLLLALTLFSWASQP